MTDWKHDGVRVIPAGSLDTNTAQTPGMNREAAINFARVGAQKLWAGTVTIHANAKTGAHHHGHLESVIYVVKGRARMRWGDQLQFVAEAGPGDFIYVPPYVPHQEINASETEPLECVLVRSDNEAVAINLDIEPAEKPETSLGRSDPSASAQALKATPSEPWRRPTDVRPSAQPTRPFKIGRSAVSNTASRANPVATMMRSNGSPGKFSRSTAPLRSRTLVRFRGCPRKNTAAPFAEVGRPFERDGSTPILIS